MNLFRENLHEAIQRQIIELLNSAGQSLNLNPRSSPRSVGDGIQDYIAQRLPDLLPANQFSKFRHDFTRRDMEDASFQDTDGNYCAVDIKTHRVSAQFSMPNLISVKRLADFYETRSNYFAVMYVSYDFIDGEWHFYTCKFVPIEYFEWSCLTIGALGWSQIQIANANRISISPQIRRAWMLEMSDRLLRFYPSELAKIKKRISYFEAIKMRWLDREAI